jgi:protein phosphatase
MQAAILTASESIYRQSEHDINLRGMGSTCACVWVIADRLYIGNVGDTRIYLVRGGFIRQLTTDHTWIQEAIDQGMLTPEQAKNHPNTHIIRRYLGSRLPVEPNLRIRPEVNALLNPFQRERGLLLQQGDRILLCSDGLTDLVEDSEILNAFRSQPIQTALELLVSLANQRGGHDNITLVALEVPDGYIADPQLNTQRRRLPVSYAAAGLFVLLGIMVVSSLLCGYLSLPAFLYAVHPRTTPTLQEQGIPGIATPEAPDRSGASQPILKNAPGSITPETNLSEPALEPTLTPWPTNTPIP